MIGLKKSSINIHDNLEKDLAREVPSGQNKLVTALQATAGDLISGIPGAIKSGAKGAVKGALTGAAIGKFGGPIGAAGGAGIGGLGGLLGLI